MGANGAWRIGAIVMGLVFMFPGGPSAALGLPTTLLHEFAGASGGGTVFSIVIPEPATLTLLAVGGLALLRRRCGYGA